MRRSISEFMRVVGLLGSRKGPFALVMLTQALMIAVCFNIVLAWMIRDVVNGAASGNGALLTRAVLVAVGTFAVGLPLFLVGNYLSLRHVRWTMRDLTTRLFGHMLHLPMTRFDQGHSGDLLSRSTNDVFTIEDILTNHLYMLILAPLTGGIAMASVFVLDWRLGLVALGNGVLIFVANAVFVRPARRASDAVQTSLATQTERLSDLLQGIQVSKLFQLDAWVHARYAAANGATIEATVRRDQLGATTSAITALLEGAGPLVMLIVGGFLAISQQVDIGTVVAASYLSGSASFLFSNIGALLTRIQRGLAGANRVFEVLDSPTEAALRRKANAGTTSGDDSMIALRDVTFSYDGERFVLRDVTLSLARGEVVALVGPSGGGKSTLMKLLLGFYAPSDGEIWIAGRPVEHYSLEEWRSHIAYVPQDAYLFDGTIEDNIRNGRSDASNDEVIAAAEAAYAHDFILQQPDGYGTRVGERGAALSGGQRQRIAIARAILKNAPILLLDEATSALDAESEQQVQRALAALMRDRTTLVSAHRPSTIAQAHHIIRLDGGRLADATRLTPYLQA
jgi:ABC-type multidrug transport system fused ATPase/permease subunit